jgi:endoglucanase
LAYRNHDTQTFQKVYRWALNNLKINSKGLFGWKWGKDAQGQWHLLDANNATDGDLWITYALILMGKEQQNESYLQRARALIQAMKTHLVIQAGPRTFLMPAADGFVSNGRLHLNPSYLLIPIYREIARFDTASTLWDKLEKSARWVLENARFTPFLLHPDWIDIRLEDGALIPSSADRFGYDAVRVPLLLTTIKDGQSLLEGYVRYIQSMRAGGTIFGPVDLQKSLIDMKHRSLAFEAVYDHIARYAGISAHFLKSIDKRVDKDDYYGYAIYLLAHP